MARLKKDTTKTVRVGPFLDKTDGVTAETGLAGSMTVYLSKDGGAFAARNSGTAITHDRDGFYAVELNATDTNTTGRLLLEVTDAATHLPVWHEFEVVAGQVFDSSVPGSDKLQVDVVEWLGVAMNALISGRVDASVQHMANDVLTAAAYATNVIGAAEFAADAATEIAAAVWDKLRADHNVAGSFGEGVRVQDVLAAALAKFFTTNSGSTYGAAVAGSVVKEIADNGSETRTRSGTAQAGAANSITLDAGASAVNDFYKGQICVITGGTGAGQSKIATGYVGATKVLSFGDNWGTNPDNTSQFRLLPLGTIPGASAPTADAVAEAVWDKKATMKVTHNHATGQTKMYDPDGVGVRGTLQLTDAVGGDANVTGMVPV